MKKWAWNTDNVTRKGISRNVMYRGKGAGSQSNVVNLAIADEIVMRGKRPILILLRRGSQQAQINVTSINNLNCETKSLYDLVSVLIHLTLTNVTCQFND
jgi:hypothetical protein